MMPRVQLRLDQTDYDNSAWSS